MEVSFTKVSIFNETISVSSKQVELRKAECSCARDLNLHIMGMSKETLLQCIIVEKATRNRVNILTRLYSRFSELRKNEEKRELFY